MSLHIYDYLSVNDMLKRFDGIDYSSGSCFGYIYMCEYGKALKIGSTVQPRKRFKTLESYARIYGDKRIGQIALSSGGFEYYREYERILHWIYSDKRMTKNGELFKLKFHATIPTFVCEFGAFLRFIDKKNPMYHSSVFIYEEYINRLANGIYV